MTIGEMPDAAFVYAREGEAGGLSRCDVRGERARIFAGLFEQARQWTLDVNVKSWNSAIEFLASDLMRIGPRKAVFSQ